MESVTESSGGDEAIRGGDHFAGALCCCRNFAPDVAGVEVDGEDAVGVGPFEREEPLLKRFLAFSLTQQINALRKLACSDHADEQIVAGEGFDGLADSALAFWMTQLGNDAGIEEDFHSFTSRDGEESRERSTSSRVGPGRAESP